MGSAQLKNIKLLVRSKAARDEQGCFVIEGMKLFQEAPCEWIREVYVSETFLAEHAAVLMEKGILFPGTSGFTKRTGMKERTDPITHQSISGRSDREEQDASKSTAPCSIIPDARFAQLCDTKTPQGILAVLKKPAWDWEAIAGKKTPLLLAADHLQDPGNAGTMLRTAEAAGADAVIFSGESVDPFHPKTVRATMGSIFRVPVFTFPTAEEMIRTLHGLDIRVYAAYLEGSVRYDTPDYKEGCAFLIGNESGGLSEDAAENADARIRIPMAGQVNSLNAGMAAGILLYEAARQRGFSSDTVNGGRTE